LRREFAFALLRPLSPRLISLSSLFCSDPTDEGLMIVGIFSHFFGLETTQVEREFFKALAILVGTRAARLSACGIAAIVSKKGYLEKVSPRHCSRFFSRMI
jgi:hexokinase